MKEILEQWQLRPDGDAFGGRARLLPVRTQDNRRAVLKVAEPAGWHAGQLPALKAWKGANTVEVLRAAPARGAVLLEELETVDLAADRMPLVAQLWRELHRPGHPAVPRLDDVLTAELDRIEAAGRSLPVPPRLAQQAVATGRRLLATTDDEVLLHGALGPEHLMQRRGELVAIAPLGLVGDPNAEAFGVLRASTGQAAQLQDAFWELADALAAAGVQADEQRLRDWTVVGAVVAASHDPSTQLVTLAKAVGAIQVGQVSPDWW